MNTGRKSVPRFDARRKKLGGAIVDVSYCVMDGDRGIPSYATWLQMLTRCYSKTYIKRFPTYKSCRVCKEWLLFSNFKKWFDENYVDGYCLDKDIIIKGNKIYSPVTCCFVPNEINALLINHKNKRGRYPIGVSKHGNKFSARLNKYSSSIWVGQFETPQKAFIAYKQAKEQYIQEIATKYYEENKITQKVYDALMKYRVEITD